MMSRMSIQRESAELSSVSMSWLESGSGPIAILVHGFPLDARMWRDQLDALAGTERRLVAPDLRGHGSSPWAGGTSHAMDRLAGDLLALADHLSARKFDLVGLSMGGYAALALANVAPERLRSLALVDTKAGPDTAEGREGRTTMAASVPREGRSWLYDKLSGALMAEGASDLVRARLRTMIEGQSYESIVADLLGMRDRPDRTDLLASLRMPSSVIVGSEDAITPPNVAREMAALLPAAELTVIEGAGHMTPMEAPEQVNSALAALWERADQTVVG
jgi:pimeloyl-ACP methyl ester carboxylesterase